MKAGIRELKYNLSHYIRRVEAGERITVTPVAVLHGLMMIGCLDSAFSPLVSSATPAIGASRRPAR
jgi:hypothetical protein